MITEATEVLKRINEKKDLGYKEEILKKINEKTSVIGIIGLGYVGLPLALRYTNGGFPVIGVDNDAEKIFKLNHNQTYISNIPEDAIQELNQKKFHATVNINELHNADAIILCLPTPLSKHREPDLSYITDTIKALMPILRSGQIISLESTTYPGTTEEVILPVIEKLGFKVGADFFLIYSPEREDPGNAEYNTYTIPKICSGHTKHCLELGMALYSAAVKQVVAVSSIRTAEMTKLLENIHRAVNIGLINEMKIVADKMGIDIHEVVDAASTKPFGFTPYYPGPGLGGHCIPIDPFYLTWKAKEYGLHTKFIELAGEINSSMPSWVVRKTIEALNDHAKSVKGSKFLIVGIAYKKDIGDTRESPSISMMEILRNKGAQLFYSDPYVPVFPKMRSHTFELQHTAIDKSILQQMDCVIIATQHSNIDYALIQQFAKLIIDTRGVYKEKYPNVVKA